MNKAIEIWNSLDLSNQTNLECARAWFMEGFAHGQKVKTLTDEEIDELVHEYNCIDDYPHEFVRACIRKAQEK